MKHVALLLLLMCCGLFTACEMNQSDSYETTTLLNGGLNTEEYSQFEENDFKQVRDHPLSTFGIDVDIASYAIVRRFIMQDGTKPPKDAVRVEEMLNYFRYDYPEPKGVHPFSVTHELMACPWDPSHRLIHIGVQGKNISTENIPPSNIVFLLDVSGSMSSQNKLPLLKEAFKMFAGELRAEDRVAIVVYAGASGLALPSTSGSDKQKVIDALNRLEAGGSTNGAGGIIQAYQVAKDNFIIGGNNRVVLATDGDFNVGISSDAELVKLIESKRDEGIFLTTLGVGMGNYKDSKLEKLADNGNGFYAYLDNLEEARRVLVGSLAGTIFTIAKDMKLQVKFDPLAVRAYRLIGYENRVLNNDDFDNDKKDAGDMGAGQSVTVLYEIIPETITYLSSGEPVQLDIRYKDPQSSSSQLVNVDISEQSSPVSANVKWASAVAQFGMILRDSKYKGNASTTSVVSLAEAARGADLDNSRSEFIDMVKKYDRIK